MGKMLKAVRIALNELPIYGVDVDPGELIKLVRVRQFPDPISFEPLAWDEDEIIAYLHPELSIRRYGFINDDGPIEL